MKPVASVHDKIRNESEFNVAKRVKSLDQMLMVQLFRENVVKSILQNTDLDTSVSTSIHPPGSFYFTSSDQTPDEKQAVFALGNFFGNGDVFVKIPWQSLQLSKPMKSLNVEVYPARIVSHGLARTNAASLEIKRDANGCIKITARKRSRKST